MKTSFKKLMAMALVLMMVLSAMPVSAAAEVGAELIKSAPSVMDKLWSGWRNAWPGQLAGKIAGRPAQKLHNEAIDGALISVDAPNLALPEGTTVEVEKITDMETIQSIIDNTPGMEAKAVNAYDITFRHNGEEVEPLYDVDVVLNASGNGEGKTVSLYHIDASAAELNSDMTCEKVENAEVSGSTVSFRANSFSIYFTAEGTDVHKVKVNFKDGEDIISTQRVSLADFDDYDGMPIYEPSIDNAAGTFTGWQIGGNGDAMLITDVNEYVKDNFIDIFETMNAEITFTPTDVTLFFIIYMSGPADDADTKAISTMPYVVNNGQVTFKVNDTFQKAGVRLQAWNGDDGETYTPGNTVTLNMSSFNTDELILYPDLVEGHWLIFETNEDENDRVNGFTPWANYNSSKYSKPEDDPNVETSRAKLIAPVFVPNGTKISEITMPIVFTPGEQYYEPTGDVADYYLEPGSEAYDYFDVYRRGYTFGGWYTDSTMNTALNQNAELSEDTTVYAKWNPGKTTVRIYLFKETYDSPTYGDSTAVPKFAYHSMLVTNEHLNENYTPVSSPLPPDDRSAYREYTWGPELISGDSFSLSFDTITYCRTHDEEDFNPIPNFADYEFEYFYFEPSDTRYTSKQINSVARLRGDGTSTLEFYLRRCAYEVEIYVPNSTGVGDVSIIDDNHIYLGPSRDGSTNYYEVIERRGSYWYYKGSNERCYNAKQVNPVAYTSTGNEKKILQYFGLYYKTLDNYLTIPTNMCGRFYRNPSFLIPFPQFFELKAASYFEAVYNPSAYPNTQGYAPTKTYRFVLNYYNQSAAAIVRVKESAANLGEYEFSDMLFWWENFGFDFGHDNLRGFFPSYVDVYTGVATSNWQNIANNPSSYKTKRTKRVVLSDYSPDDLWEIFEDQALDWLMADYPDDPNWSSYNANKKSTKDALIAYSRSAYPNHEVWTQYTLSASPTVPEIYDFFRSYYPNEPLWNGPQTARSHTSTGGFIITYSNGNETDVRYTTNESEYRYVNTGATATATNGTVLLIHEARRTYPLTYTSLDSAAFGLEADDTWVAYGITANQEHRFRPLQGIAYRSNPNFEPEGKSFAGWYADKSFTDLYDGDDPFGAYGQLVYAGYVPAKYRVVVHYGSEEYPNMQFPNGTPESTLVVEHGDLLEADLANAATLEGYSIVEWVDEDGSPFKFDSTKIGPNIADTENYDGSNKMGVDEFGRAYDDTEASDVKGIVHIYARWGLDEFNDESIKIVYDAIYGEGTINGNVIVPDAHVYADGSIAFGRPAATAEGDDMHFAYWELHKPDGSTVRVYPGQRFEVNASDAVPYQPGYDMTWNYKDADGSPLTATNKCLPGQRPTAPAGVPEGYVENGHYYAFQGWTPDPNTIPEGAMTFTARYGAAQDIPNVTITLDYQSVQPNTTATAAYGSSYTVPDVTLADNSPYYFLGWSKTADGDVAYNANDSVTIDSTSDFTLYAVWASRIIYKDGYNGVGAPMADVITYTDYNASTYSPIGVTELEWEHSGYAFVGWTYNGTTVQPGDTISNPTYPITLTAQWLDGHNVIYHANNGTDATISQFVNYGQSFTFKTASELSGFSRTGYHMTGRLYENAECTGTYYNFDASHVSISADLHVYVQWEADEITITFNPGNATGNTQYNKTAHYDDVWNGNEPILNNTFVAPNDNKHFVGWMLNTTNQQMTYPYTVTEDITLTAIWGNKDYHITFNGGGADGGSMPDDVYRDYGESYGLPTCEFTRTDYDFAGWSVGGQIVSQSIIINGPTTITATWEESKFKPISLSGTVTFDDSKVYLIGVVNGGNIYLLSSNAATGGYSNYRALVSKSYNSTGLKLTGSDNALLWKLSGNSNNFTIKSKATGSWLILDYASAQYPKLSNTSGNWMIKNSSQLYTNMGNFAGKVGMTFVYSSNPMYAYSGTSPNSVVILCKSDTNLNILPAPESKLSAATKSEKAVKGNAAAPAVNTTKAAPEIVSRDVTPEPGEDVIYLTAVYVERIEYIDKTRIILDANGLTFNQDAKSWIELMNGNIGWDDIDHKRIISDPVDFENGIASVKIPGPQVFDQSNMAGYRLIGWNTQPDGSGVEIHFSGITNDAGQYDAKFSSANELQVYIDNLDKGNKNTRINTLYAMWEGYTAFYHSSNNTIEPNDNGPVKYPDNTVGGTLVYSTYAGVDTTVNIPELVPTGYLYGGYYKDYEGKGTEYKFADISDVTDAVAYNGANANWDMDDTDKGAYTNRGDEFSVKKNEVSDYIGKTIYIKEVPANKYLRLYSYCTYNRSDKTIRSWWLITDTDDKNYQQTGFIIDGVVTPCQSWPKTVKISPKNADPNDTETGAKTMSESTFGAPRAWVPYKGYREDSNNSGRFEALENKTYTNYWITPDNILVIGTRQRTFGSDISSMNTISNNLTNADYTGDKYYYTETVND